jgi:predicted ArsR family transcriptional regulator
MKTNVAQTSLVTFRALKDGGHLSPKEHEVMDLMDLGYAMTREQIADALGWKEASVCGRVNALVTSGLLVEEAGGKTTSGRPAKYVRIPRKGQAELFQQ